VDLLEIWSYFSPNGFDQADDFLNELETTFEFLAANPLAGRARDELQKGLRSFVHSNYLISYRVIRDTVEIARVLHGWRDLPSIFGEES
jgi:toxin ParE1/3/4